jgi:hypothetical protein
MAAIGVPIAPVIPTPMVTTIATMVTAEAAIVATKATVGATER